MVLVLCLLQTLAGSPSPPEVRAAVDDVLSEGNYQRAIPERDGEAAGGKLTVRPPRRSRAPSGLASIANVVLWVLSIAVAGILLVWLVKELVLDRDAIGADDGPAPPASAPPDEAVIARPLGDAELFAGEGRYAEAIHVLLLRTLDELRRRSPTAIPRALTSREILARVPLHERARRELGGLVTAVELTHFGGEVPSEAEYRLCRDHFERFAAAYRSAAG